MKVRVTEKRLRRILVSPKYFEIWLEKYPYTIVGVPRCFNCPIYKFLCSVFSWRIPQVTRSYLTFVENQEIVKLAFPWVCKFVVEVDKIDAGIVDKDTARKILKAVIASGI
jgi:hypothetical protein